MELSIFPFDSVHFCSTYLKHLLVAYMSMIIFLCHYFQLVSLDLNYISWRLQIIKSLKKNLI